MKNIGVCEKLREELAPKKNQPPGRTSNNGSPGSLPDFARRAAIIAEKHVAVQTK